MLGAKRVQQTDINYDYYYYCYEDVDPIRMANAILIDRAERLIVCLNISSKTTEDGSERNVCIHIGRRIGAVPLLQMSLQHFAIWVCVCATCN